jgi:mRNA interferase RelE/StbE
MAYTVSLSEKALRDLDSLDVSPLKRIFKFLDERLSRLDNPRSIGAALQGSKLKNHWKYRVGDYRIIARIEDSFLVIGIIRIGHRREVYR